MYTQNFMFQKCLKLREKQIIQEDPHHSGRKKRHPRPVSDDKKKGEKQQHRVQPLHSSQEYFWKKHKISLQIGVRRTHYKAERSSALQRSDSVEVYYRRGRIIAFKRSILHSQSMGACTQFNFGEK